MKRKTPIYSICIFQQKNTASYLPIYSQKVFGTHHPIHWKGIAFENKIREKWSDDVCPWTNTCGNKPLFTFAICYISNNSFLIYVLWEEKNFH